MEQEVLKSSESPHKSSHLEFAAWLLFCCVCVQMALSPWHFGVIPGEKVNLFFGMLASAALLAALLCVRKDRPRVGLLEALISLTLLTLGVASGLHSSIPLSSSARAFVLVATGLGGFWCARILVTTQSRQRGCVWLGAGILTGLVILAILGQLLFGATNGLVSMVYNGPHPLAHMVFLLLFAPLALIGTRKVLPVVFGVLLVVLSIIVLYLCGTFGGTASTVLIIPFMALVVVFAARSNRAVGLSLVLLILASALGAYFVSYVSRDAFASPTYQVYRLESYPFSWHVAKKEPVLGIGLRAPRNKYLEDYEVWHPRANREGFGRTLRGAVTPENTFLALMTGCGIPFAVIYIGVLIVLFLRLVRLVDRPPADLFFHPIVLLVPITGSLLHSFTTDTLLHPEICWFFQIMLGLIPESPQEPAAQTVTWASWSFRLAGSIGGIILGIAVGTHQAFAPGQMNGEFAVSSYLEKLPIVSAWYVKETKTEVKPQPRPRPGSLVVKFENIDPGRVRWKVMCIIDNSPTMAQRKDPWNAGRLETAADFVQRVSSALPPRSLIAVRAFSSGVSGKAGGTEIPLTVSRPLDGWSDPTQFAGMEMWAHLKPVDRTDMCTAASHSVRSDFGTNTTFAPRLILLTDGESRCWAHAARELVRTFKSRGIAPVDVVALGMSEADKEKYSALVTETGGTFVPVEKPENLGPTAIRYSSVFQQSKPVKLDILGKQGVAKISPDMKIDLPPGSYSVCLPTDLGLPQTAQVIQGVKIEADKTTVFSISLEKGRLRVHTATQ